MTYLMGSPTLGTHFRYAVSIFSLFFLSKNLVGSAVLTIYMLLLELYKKARIRVNLDQIYLIQPNLV
jgi:hypothetical protein